MWGEAGLLSCAHERAPEYRVSRVLLVMMRLPPREIVFPPPATSPPSSFEHIFHFKGILSKRKSPMVAAIARGRVWCFSWCKFYESPPLKMRLRRGCWGGAGCRWNLFGGI